MRQVILTGCVLAAALASSALAQQPSQQANVRPRGAISGVVINGVTKQPVADALVQLRWPQQRQFPEIQIRQFSDAKGRFLFSDLPASDAYTVWATRTGYFEAAYGLERRDFEPGANIELADGQWFQDARLTLWPPSSISGTVTDERGEPVVNVFVEVLAELRRGGATHLAASEFTMTDDRGMFRSGMLHPGTYYVMVPSLQASAPASADAPALRGMPVAAAAELRTSGRPLGSYDPPLIDAGSSMKLAMLGYPIPPPPSGGRTYAYPHAFAGGSSISNATAVALEPGMDRTGVDVRLTPVLASRITGVVEGSPEARANCLLRLLPAGLEELGLWSEAATTFSGPDGSFTFANVPSGNYTIEVPLTLNQYVAGDIRFASPRPGLPPGVSGMDTMSSFLPGSPGFGVASGDGNPRDTWARVAVSVSAREETGVVVPLGPSIKLSGRVVFDAVNGQKPPSATPAVQPERADGRAWLGFLGSSRSAPAGGFEVPGLVPGSYLLKSTSTFWRLKSVTAGGRDVTYQPIELSSDASYSDLVVTFTNSTTEVSGSVSAANDKPSPSSAVIAFPVEAEQWANYGLYPARITSVRTSSSGQFRFTSLPAGSYYVVAVPGAFADAWTDPAFLKRAVTSATRVAVQWGETKSIPLKLAEIR